jgi:hypothetical protein
MNLKKPFVDRCQIDVFKHVILMLNNDMDSLLP